MDGSILILFASVLIIGGLLFAVITFTKKGVTSLNVDRYRVKWLSIEQQLKQDEVSSYHMSVLNADKLLDQALRDRGVKGNTNPGNENFGTNVHVQGSCYSRCEMGW